MTKKCKITFTLLVTFLCACSFQTPDKEVVSASIKSIMPPKYEVIKVVPVKEMGGLLEVSLIMDGRPVIIYMDRKAKYVLTGNLMQIETKKNLTTEAQGKIK